MAGANLVRKKEISSKLNERFESVRVAVIGHNHGTTVGQITELRDSLREKGIEFKVIKNTMAKVAIKGTELEVLNDHFSGPTTLAYSDDDPVALAKALNDFAKANEKFEIQAGVLKGQLLEKEQVIALANIPSKEVLLGRLVGTLQNPISGFVCATSGILGKAVYALDAIRREKEKQQ